MKTITLFTIITLLIPSYIHSQIFGNTIHDTQFGFTNGYITFWRIETGPTDSGVFTHFGIFDSAIGTSCDVKFAIYSNDEATTKPLNLIVDGVMSNPINGEWNQTEFNSSPTIEANTTYWIAVRPSCTYQNERQNLVNWSLPPLYFRSWSYNGNWPSPVTNMGSQSTAGNHAIFITGNGPAILLPIELISFDATLIDHITTLEWKVASETNNKGWNVQHSTNGFSWNTIGWIDGAKDSNRETNYQYTHEDIAPNLNFYRLEQVDIDGQTSYSNIEFVEYLEAYPEYQVYPNPTHNLLHLQGLDSSDITLFNNAGKEILKTCLEPGSTLDLSSYPAGQYLLSINKGGKIKTIPIIKN